MTQEISARSVRVAAIDELPVSLAEAKAWMGAHLPDDDVLLAGLIRTAAEMCEAYIGRLLVARTVVEVAPIAMGAWTKLAREPVLEVTSIEGLPAEGAAFLFAADAYQIDVAGAAQGWVRVLLPSVAGRMRVTYRAGLGDDANALPESIRQGIVRLVAHLYAARDDGRDVSPPAAVLALWQPWRVIISACLLMASPNPTALRATARVGWRSQATKPALRIISKA